MRERIRRYFPNRLLRGTMVTHDEREHHGLTVSTDAERLQKRKKSRAPKRRISSDGHSRRSKHYKISSEETSPTVYSTLVRVLFVLAHIRPGPCEELFNVVAGWTQEGLTLSESDIVSMEDMFNSVEYRLNYLFHSWVRKLKIYDDAYDYMDIPFIVYAVTHAAHDHVMKSTSHSERQSITVALQMLHAHLNVPSPNRRTSI